MKFRTLVFILSTFYALGSNSLQAQENIPVAEETALTYNDVKPILDTTCAPCHSGENAPRALLYDTEEDSILHAGAALHFVISRRMPPESPDFSTSEEGLKLLKWLKNPLPSAARK